ncbi:MAG: pyridoxal phosphate-dependent aminotransferase [SAR202 cluster bacterium]|nr:pyridoxal phosphate-dependent aminotransferase [SAR202 cluster bacterium]
MTVSKRTVQAMEEGGWIRRMFEIGIELKKKHGPMKVFDLSLGNPVVEPPKRFNERLKQLALSSTPGTHRYMPNAGYPEVRARVAQSIARETGLPFTAGEVVMTCGAAGALNVIFETILNPNDEVVIFAPFFGEFTFYIENHRGKAIICPTNDSFLPDLAALEELITKKTRAVLINSPNNPSGVMYPEDVIKGIGELLGKKEKQFGTEIFLISDEPYRRLIFDGLKYPRIFGHHQASIAVHSHSKDLAIPGERIGYIAVNPGYEDRAQLVDGAIFWNRSLGFVNAPAIIQMAVADLQGTSVDVMEYQKKRDFLYGQLTEMGYQIVKPQGAFYMFPKSPIEDDVEFVGALQEWNVLTVPGKGFGAPGFFRISYCVEDWVLQGAMKGFAEAAKKFGV